MSFDEISASLLSSPAGEFGELTWDVEPDPYQRLDVPEGAPLDAILRLLPRRGLAPLVATRLLEAFPARPLERALIAWDLVSRALLGANDGALYTQITNEIVPMKAFGGARKAAVPRESVPDLIEAARGDDDGDALPSLAVLARGPNSTDRVEAALAHAKQLALAHLPSLALAFVQVLWAQFAVPDALDLLLEIALDHGVTEAIPIMPGTDDRSMVQQAYMIVRDRLADYQPDAARQLLAVLMNHPGVARSDDPRLALALARAEIEIQSGQSPPPELAAAVSAAAPFGTRWRYAAYVRDAVSMWRDPESPIVRLENFIGLFGNDAPMWGQVSYHEARRAELLTVLSRELRYQVHDPDAWRAFSIFIEQTVGNMVGEEVDSRLATQLADVLS